MAILILNPVDTMRLKAGQLSQAGFILHIMQER